MDEPLTPAPQPAGEEQAPKAGGTRRGGKRANKKSQAPRDADKGAAAVVSDATKGFMTKTQMCRFHEAGKCARGSDCTFAHDPSELKSAPDFTKTRMCEAFKAGSCNDSKCSFAHDPDELRKIDPAIADQVAAQRKKRQQQAQEERSSRRGRGGSRSRSRSNSRDRLVCDRCHSSVALHLGVEFCGLCKFHTRYYSDRYV